MFMYPKSARKAIKKFISKKLKIEKLSKKHQYILLEYGLHGFLPESLYNDAIRFDIMNIRFFSPKIVKVIDIINVFKNLCRLDNYLEEIILYHKKSLMVSGLNVIKFMLEFNILLSSDIEWIVNENIINVVHILKINPSLITFKISLSLTQIVDVVKDLSIKDVIHVYSIVNNLNLSTILYISDNFNIPPLHNILYTLYDVCECFKLIKKYPMYDIINFIHSDVKYNPEFINSVKEFIDKNLPNLYDSLNIYLVSVIPNSNLLNEYKIKTVAMFGFTYKTDINTLSNDERDFIKYNISYYDAKDKEFTKIFRQTDPTCIPMSVKNITRSRFKKHSFKSSVIKKEKDSLDDILKYIDNNRKKLSIHDIETILSTYQNPCIVRRIIISSININTKIILLKIIKDWKPMINNNIKVSRNTMNEIYTKILHNHKKIFSYLSSVTSNNDIINCKCFRCSSLFFKDLKSINANLFTDDGLLSRLYDLCRYAIHGKINQNIVGFNCWGPLIDIMYNENKRKRLPMLLKNIKLSNILVCGKDIYKTLVNITETPSYKLMIDSIYVLNDQYAKIVIFFNTIIEYIISTVYYRVVILDNTKNVREFVSKVLNTSIESCGILFHHVDVDKKIEYELYNMNEHGIITTYLYDLAFNVISIILDDINGVD
ncbi:hypothetical protein YKV046c [Yokapox virus]|uniref:Uncharacterized protein n=1 Tax=Yokapox virus TaxID=1076255 RepID=G3EIC4_9POXV|nr:hypothetical protein YKV046c [Yokapox virus]AEN03635.1 unknown protein [Yokapox virus]